MNLAISKKFLFAVVFGLLFSLAACGSNSGTNSGNEASTTENPEPDDDGQFDIEDFDEVSKTGDAMDGGELTYGLISDTPFEGTLNWNFYSGDPDSQILDWFDESLIEDDENFVYNDEGIADLEVNEDDNSVTVSIPDDVKWSDGEPLTIDDFAFAYKVLAHPNYDGVRYGSVDGVVGLDPESDWHTQDADDDATIDTDEDIKGLDIEDDQTMTITFEELTPSTTTGGMWPYALPKHKFEDIPVADMAESDEVRKDPVGLGPYIVDNVVAGESVTMSANENYWQGEPALDKVTVQVVDPSNMLKALQSGEIDVAEFNADQYADNYDMSNVQFLGVTDLSYSYIGFKLGDWDQDEGKVNYKPDDMKMGDKDLRKAMWYAVDNDAVGDEFYHGLRWRANTLIDPAHDEYHSDDIEVPDYNPDKANEILDEAGYKWDDNDEYRLDKDGNELTINMASQSGSEVAEPMANYYMQAWEEVGLNVELVDGRLLEFNSFYERVGEEGEDDPDIDIFAGAWSTGSDIDPTGLYGKNELFNFSRYESDENDELLKEGLSDKAFDVDERADVYDEWQQLMAEDIPVFPTLYRAEVTAVNNRVVNYDASYDKDYDIFEIGVTEDDPEVEE